MMHLRLTIFWGLLIMSATANADRVLSKEIIVNAPVSEVWRAWTTAEGLKFVSNKSRIEPEPGGAYEWFLDLEPDENGLSGSESSHVLAVLPEQVLVFNWNFPPDVPSLRASGAMTQVIIRLDALSAGATKVSLDVVGWRSGTDWDAGYAYFDLAWSRVLQALQDAH